VWKKGR